MALKMPKLFGEKAASATDTDLDIPTTQVKMGAAATARYDPLASVSIMDQLRTASAAAPKSKRLPVIGNLAIVKQMQVLGALVVAFVVLAGLMLWLDGRTASQQAASSATVTDLQTFSQRLARSSVAAAQGMPGAVAAVKESRERFRAALDAFLAGGTARGVSLDVTQDPAVVDLLAAVKARWEKVNAAVDRLLGNEATLTALANSEETIGKNGAGLPELAQQAGQQMLQAGGSARDVEQGAQMAGLAQRIARNVGTLTSSDDMDPDAAAALPPELPPVPH